MPRIAPDANDIIVIPFTETTSTRPNLGTAGAQADFTDYGSPVSCQGLISVNSSTKALYIPSTYLVNARNGSGGGANTLATPNVSLSGWVYLRKYTNYSGVVFNKQYFANGWSNPWLTFGFQFTAANNGELDLYITFGGVLQSALRTPNRYFFPVGRWCHLGGTFDGTTMNMYINGSLAATGTYSGTPDYGTEGNRGLWYAGGIPGTSNNQDSPIIVQDIRVANIARPQSYFANIYYNGFQL